ncbi:MAG: ABC transporter substrate-binding protein [Candidatus Hydrogenedentes bacterium]|nr:ABC transporter substrate-binding protein [Candidatus Hydrogenedentota bacterium]
MSKARTILFFVGLVAVLAGLYALTGAPPEAPPGKVIIDVWHPWPGDQGDEFRRLVDEFNAASDSIQVRLLYVPNNLSSNQKLFLSISAGCPPDCTFVDGPQVAEWAARRAVEPLDDLMAAYGIANEEFWGPCARQNQFRGATYALTYCADPNFAFFWNREVFEEAGLAEQGAPRTLEELDRVSRALTAYEDGRMTRIGFIPWNVFGYANSMFTWGWAFGGRFYDYETERIVCGEDPGVLEALNWMKSYADEYGFQEVSSFAEGFGDQADNPFARGKIAMAAGHVTNIQLFRKYSPGLDYGAVPFPYPERMGSDHSVWMGGWCIAIPRGSRRPDAAFQFMKWLCTSEEAGRSMIVTTGTFPAYIHSPAFELAQRDDKLAVFYEILKTTQHQRPVMPAQAYFMGALDRAVSDVLNGIETPEEALMQAQAETQKELDRVLEGWGGRGTGP